jgi:hypothetical protein
VPGKGCCIDIKPDQTAATAKELAVATRIEIALQSVIQYFASKAGKCQVLEGTGGNCFEAIAERMKREFGSPLM